MIRKKFKDLEENPNFDLEQKGMGYREILGKSKVFKVGRVSPAQVDKAIVTPAERADMLASESAKIVSATAFGQCSLCTKRGVELTRIN